MYKYGFVEAKFCRFMIVFVSKKIVHPGTMAQRVLAGIRNFKRYCFCVRTLWYCSDPTMEHAGTKSEDQR